MLFYPALFCQIGSIVIKMMRLIIGLVGFLFVTTGQALVITTPNSSVNLYLGLFGSSDNPSHRMGCYDTKNNSFSGKELIEYRYTVMNCGDTANKIVTPGRLSSPQSLISDDMDETLRHVLTRVSAIQFGINFVLDS